MAAPGEEYRLAYPENAKTYISYGLPFIQACAHHITNTFHASKGLQDAIGDKIVGVRRGIKPHTPWDDILDIVKDVREVDADLIVSLGAGSLTDGAKAISLALANGVSTLDDLAAISGDTHGKELEPCSIPVINIPTSLSGGEYSAFAGITDKRTNHKVQLKHPSMAPSLVILDPALSISTPQRIWLSTGIRAVDHCVEGLCSSSETASSTSDAFAVEGLKLLVPNLLSTLKNWEDVEPRLQEMLGVIESVKSIGAGVALGASHGIGHQLGPLGVGHGETFCIMLPAVLQYNHDHGDDSVRSKQKKVLDALWNDETVATVLDSRGLKKESANAADALDTIIRELGLPRTLADVGVKRTALDALADNCLKDPWLKTNPVPLVTKHQVLEVLEMVVGRDGLDGT